MALSNVFYGNPNAWKINFIDGAKKLKKKEEIMAKPHIHALISSSGFSTECLCP